MDIQPDTTKARYLGKLSISLDPCKKNIRCRRHNQCLIHIPGIFPFQDAPSDFLPSQDFF